MNQLPQPYFHGETPNFFLQKPTQECASRERNRDVAFPGRAESVRIPIFANFVPILKVSESECQKLKVSEPDSVIIF